MSAERRLADLNVSMSDFAKLHMEGERNRPREFLFPERVQVHEHNRERQARVNNQYASFLTKAKITKSIIMRGNW